MKWSELKRLATKNGWILARHGGGHDIYYHQEKEGVIVMGRHDSEEVANGTAAKIKKQIGV